MLIYIFKIFGGGRTSSNPVRGQKIFMRPVPFDTITEAPSAEAMASVEQYKKLHNNLKWPLIAYSLLAGLYMSTVGKNAGTWTWFNWHPLCMLLGFVGLAGNAALIKKIGGYENTKMHGIMMFVAVALSSFAWYVIYTNKEMMGKAHLMTLHGKLGFVVMLSYFGFGIVGSAALHPDFGLMKTNKTIRLAHKVGGRVTTALAWACCVLGFATMQTGQLQRAIFTFPLLIFGFYVLL